MYINTTVSIYSSQYSLSSSEPSCIHRLLSINSVKLQFEMTRVYLLVYISLLAVVFSAEVFSFPAFSRGGAGVFPGENGKHFIYLIWGVFTTYLNRRANTSYSFFYLPSLSPYHYFSNTNKNPFPGHELKSCKSLILLLTALFPLPTRILDHAWYVFAKQETKDPWRNATGKQVRNRYCSFFIIYMYIFIIYMYISLYSDCNLHWFHFSSRKRSTRSVRKCLACAPRTW